MSSAVPGPAPTIAPSSFLDALHEYEAALQELQRVYRRLCAARGDARAAAERDYAEALAKVRALASGLRGPAAA